MRVAIITAGQPRFTKDFITVLNQLKGFDTADLYINLWESDWAESETEACNRIKKILPPHIILKKLSIVPQPDNTLHTTNEELNWWYVRRLSQLHGLKLAYELITDTYDVIIRIRPDGCLTTGDLDISTIDVKSNGIIFCNRLVGKNQTEPGDQFFLGTPEGFKFLFDLYENFDNYMIEICPEWKINFHDWALEYFFGAYFRKRGVTPVRGLFDHDINISGKSSYSDKHTHLPVAEDPTK